MADPIISKGAVRAITPKQDFGTAATEKGGPSKFDQIRSNLQDDRLNVPYNLPPQVTQVSGQQTRILESDLRKRMQAGRSRSPREVFKVDMKRTQVSMEGLTRQVNALPKTSAFDPIRQRLNTIEANFKATGELVNGLAGTNNPRDLLKVQVQIYQMTQNIELVSKVVEQVNSGIKSILQTQV